MRIGIVANFRFSRSGRVGEITLRRLLNLMMSTKVLLNESAPSQVHCYLQGIDELLVRGLVIFPGKASQSRDLTKPGICHDSLPCSFIIQLLFDCPPDCSFHLSLHKCFNAGHNFSGKLELAALTFWEQSASDV